MSDRAYKVCALCFTFSSLPLAPMLPGQNVAGTAATREHALARQAAEQRCAELTADLARTQRMLDEARRKNAELQVRCRRAESDIQMLRLQAANLLDGRSSPELGRLLKEALLSLQSVRKAERDVCKQVRTFKPYLDTVLDVLQASQPTRQGTLSRYARVIEACERLEHQPPVVAGRGGAGTGRFTCRVLVVNDDLQPVVLDAGSVAGVRVGTRVSVSNKDVVVAKLRVVEVRPHISAAVPVTGSLRNIAPGTQVQLGKTERK